MNFQNCYNLGEVEGFTGIWGHQLLPCGELGSSRHPVDHGGCSALLGWARSPKFHLSTFIPPPSPICIQFFVYHCQTENCNSLSGKLKLRPFISVSWETFLDIEDHPVIPNHGVCRGNPWTFQHFNYYSYSGKHFPDFPLYLCRNQINLL